VIGINGVDVVFTEQFPEYIHGCTIFYHDRTAEVFELLVEVGNFIVNEFDTGILLVLEFVQDVAIKNKERQYRMLAAQSVIESGVVVQAQIATKPEKVDCWHVI